MAARPGLIRRFFGGLWRALDFSRRLVVNLLFLLIVAVLLIGWFSSDKPPRLQPDTALVLNIQGDVVEEYSVGAQEAAIAEALGRDRFETRLRDILAVLDGAARDPQVTRVVLVLDDMGSAGLATLREIGAALERVRGSGKPVVAWGESYTQGQYFLAAHADEVYLHPSGALLLRGVGGNRSYCKDLLDKVGVKVNTFQAGRYKSFGEPFTRTGPTPEAQEADAYLYNGLWSTWLARCRALAQAEGGERDGGDQRSAGAAAGGGWRHRRTGREREARRRVEATRRIPRPDDPARRPAHDDDAVTFRQISMYSYLRYVDDRTAGPAIGVVVAQGEIVDGDARKGTVGARAAAELIQRARQDDDIKALVVRVDSPGGSASASELTASSSNSRARRASPLSCRWATWRRPAVTGSPWGATKWSPMRRRSPVPSECSRWCRPLPARWRR